MKQTRDNSVRCALALVYGCALLIAVIAVGLPFFLEWYQNHYAGHADSRYTVLMIAYYASLPEAAMALWRLHRLLRHVQQSRVFINDNVTSLGVLSWCCAMVATVTLVTGCFYFPLLVIALAAAFMAVILRVLRRAFMVAVVLKNENELTI